MQITASLVPNTFSRSASQPARASASGGEHFAPAHRVSDNVKWGAVMAVCGGLGYAGSAAHAIPVVGPAVSGVAGAVVGASAGALIASKARGEHIKLGAVAGLVAGAILGANAGTPVTGVVMAAAGATVPIGGLLAIMSGAT